MSKQFDFIISFMGTVACSPEMKALLDSEFDSRFIFNSWNQKLIDKLLLQQEQLKSRGITRNICILVDDIVLSGKDEDSLSHLCLRGRHFNLSIIMCAVSYTTLPKRARRSLDALFLFSCPMSGDCQILCAEYAQQARMARYCLQNLPKWTSLVMMTLEKKQRLFHYRVYLNTKAQTSKLLAPASSEKEVLTDSLLHNQTHDHSERNVESSNCNESQENCESAYLEKSELDVTPV